MFNATNFKAALLVMGFSEDGDSYEKRFSHFHCAMRVDFSKRKLIYPEEIRGRERNDSFDKPENFVVFECVNRLLEKGYRPEHIELEKEWHLGHDSKGGRADVCVYDSNGKMLLIVECKTFGREFDKALKDTMSDGGQLFSYWQQERSTQWMMLYSSDIDDEQIKFKDPTICCNDDRNITALAKKDKSIHLYATASTAESKFSVWKDTYSFRMHEHHIVFSQDSVAYKIGVKPLRKKDLRDFAPEDKIVNRFEEILRHNNVSDKENAFNRLVALFICKLVDESTKGENDEVEFQYKQGTDTYETLQDRLQRLHKEGMEKFMREEIYYVPADYPEWLFATYTGQQRKKAIEDLSDKLRILKFYSNNDFAFKDVHNEELFLQNGKILVEVVQLFEKYRIVYPSKHQFLGDLFEQLLNKGFKQNEGQFFTPTPITRFIWDCLPVAKMVHSERGIAYPKVIDYACGAGHFLTEAIVAINAFADNHGDNSWVRNHIFGIEKDYRLARVSKISLFMNGAGEGNIIFGDGLENAPEKQIENGAFDVLVANPPYSVSGFKQHLQLKNNSLELLGQIGENGSEIEVLFVERITQLLKPCGVAAVILPASILSNDSNCYKGAREQLLQNFYIRGIVQFGSKTFGATGTNTVVLFLEKFNEPPKKKDLIQDSVHAIIYEMRKELKDWQDREIYEEYLKQIEVPQDEYEVFRGQTANVEQLRTIGYFKRYVDVFQASTEYKNLQKNKQFKALSASEQEEQVTKRVYDFIREIEADKIFYFALTYHQKTVIVTAPTDNNEQKEFLGYDWSNRKGNEGIQIINPGGKLYNDNDREDENTLASAIRMSFDNLCTAISKENAAFAGVATTSQMFEYSRCSFNKAFRLSARQVIELKSKYPMELLGSVAPFVTERLPYADILPESYISTDNMLQNREGVVVYNGEPNIQNVIQYKQDDILISNIRPYLKKIWFADKTGGCSPDVLVFRVNNPSECIPKFLFYVLSQDVFFDYMMADKKGAKMPRGDKDLIPTFKVPIPPISIQRRIVKECEKIDVEYGKTRMSIEDYQKRISQLFDSLDVIQGGVKLTLSNTTDFSVLIGKRVVNTELIVGGSIPVFSANVYEPFGYVDKLLIRDFSKDSILWGIDGDWMVNFYSKGKQFYPTDHCGVLRVLTEKVNPRYMARVLLREGKKMNFSRVYRASMDRIQSISFTVPDIHIQNNVVDQVLELEAKIAIEQSKLVDMHSKKTAILEKYL